ncbi:MAG: hypothetical protein NW206_08685 [Hyphomonadaceae bacterium]|nr:hypothetical protein [Hyphomonadaceae bacterium]
MRAIISVLAWSMFGLSAANAQEIDRTEAPGMASDQASLRFAGMCMDMRHGLPRLGEYTRAPIIRWQCDGGQSKNMHLENGSIFIGTERAFHVRPSWIPSRGCYDNEVTSESTRYVFHVCAGRQAFSVDRSQPGVVTYHVTGRGGARALIPGAPLYGERIETRRPFNRFTLNEAGDRLMVAGTNLCVIGPSGDASMGTPLYLDRCDAPDQIDPAIADDGAARARVELTSP